RTCDFLVPNQALYQAEPHPVFTAATIQFFLAELSCHPKRKINYMAEPPLCQHIFLFFSQISTIHSQTLENSRFSGSTFFMTQGRFPSRMREITRFLITFQSEVPL
ncbi:MAG: hypothetical protein K5889_05370, partial [Lachnospiraceae bacterium]|nr:hypothetical protein [Lachnospiraceae bacterium]